MVDAPMTTPAAVARPIFTELLERHGPELHRFALRLCRNAADADDLYQEMALKAYRAFGRLDPDANYRAWLYRIVSNTYLSDRRKYGRIDPLGDDAAAALPAPQHDEADRLDARELLGAVDRLVQRLPPKQRIALIGRKYHDLSYAELAAVLGSSEEAARANVYEALRKLRAGLGDRLG